MQPQAPNQADPQVLQAPGTPEVTDQQRKELLELITARFDKSYNGVHARWRQKAERMYALYHNFNEFKGQWRVDRRDRDVNFDEAKATFGADLFIPYAFSTVETILPRMLGQRPSILIRPRNPASDQNVENMKLIVEAQQERLDYELVLQKIARNALITGLGVQKVYWVKKSHPVKVIVPGPDSSKPWVVQTQDRGWDDPMIESVDPWEWIYDDMADSMRTLGWCIHRAWRSTDYCKAMIQSGIWTGLTEQDITQGPGGGPKYVESVQNRMKINGYPDMRPPDTHEVWEYHDGKRVITALDRQWVVQVGMNPAWHGEVPFQANRPTVVDGQMAGKGEIEPMEDLQAEVNTMRSQRRDNAAVILQRSFFYADGMIDPGDFKIGPGKGVPVVGDPREAIYPIEFGEIPNSSYMEGRELQADIERTTGIDDSLSGAGGATQTATGIQMVQAAANERIRQKTRNLEVELVRAGGRQLLSLNQQRIVTARDVRVPVEPMPGETEHRWAWRKVGPQELMGEFDIDVEGGSMAPVNVAQDRQDAQLMLSLAQSEQIGQTLNPEMVRDYVLRKSGISNPSAWKVPAQPEIPQDVVAKVFDALKAAGVSGQLLEQAQQAALGDQS